jgi:hypothetical protein
MLRDGGAALHDELLLIDFDQSFKIRVLDRLEEFIKAFFLNRSSRSISV